MSKSKNNNLGSVLTKTPNETITIYTASTEALPNNVIIVKDGEAYTFKSSSILETGVLAIADRRALFNDEGTPNRPYLDPSLSFTTEANSARLLLLQMYLSRALGHNTKSKKQTKDTCSIKNGRRK